MQTQKWKKIEVWAAAGTIIGFISMMVSPAESCLGSFGAVAVLFGLVVFIVARIKN